MIFFAGLALAFVVVGWRFALTSGAPAAPAGRQTVYKMGGSVAGIIFGGLVYFFVFLLTRPIGPGPQGALQLVTGCIFEYKLAHQQTGFPTTLSTLGPSGTACLDKELAGGHAGGFVFKYVAERSGNSQVPHFHLTTDKDWF